MTKLRVAHIREQGVDLIIVPLDKSFASKSAADQQSALEALQMSATLAGRAGDVVPVWESANNGIAFLAHKTTTRIS